MEEPCTGVECDFSFLQVGWDVHHSFLSVNGTVNGAVDGPEVMDALASFSKGIIAFVFLSFLAVVVYWLICGLPMKAPQHSSVKDGCPPNILIFLCLTYTFTWFTTDQYVPSLPQMGRDLSGSQSIMSATVQLNFVVKALSGLVTASLSDRLGRRPALLSCLSLLCLASFCCGCARRIEWFVAARFLQGLGESVEPVLFACCRDYISDEAQRLAVVASLQLMAIGGMVVSPVFGGLVAEISGWRSSFWVLAVIWGGLALYAWLNVVETCPDGKEEMEFKGLSRILAPGCLCLLLSESCIMSAFEVFNSNIGYVAQVSYSQTPMATAYIMLGWGAFDLIGVLLMWALQAKAQLTIAQTARILMTCITFVGLISLYLRSSSEFLWAYLLSSFLQALLVAAALVPLNVLYYQPLEDCAGMAAAVEIMFKNLPPCLYCLASTNVLVHHGIRSMMDLQSVSFLGAGILVLGYAFF